MAVHIVLAFVAWVGVIVFAVALGRAAAKPCPPVRRGERERAGDRP